ncbi:MAG: hypothetical protein Q9M36_14495 [Sulfurovum sp.]|nr:hypothetical protein [Sulfurovum sp.]
MIALNQNYFNIEYFMPSFKEENSLAKGFRVYISILKELYGLNTFLQSSIYNIEHFLLLNGADDVEKIDNILMKLELFTDLSSGLLEENKELQLWYNSPLHWMLDRVESSNMSLQAMLGSKQAELMHQNTDED